MAYLVRRLLENTANTGFLRLSFHEGHALRTLLAPPRPRPGSSRPAPEKTPHRTTPFANCPLADFTDPHTHKAFSLAIEDTIATLPQRVPIVIDGQKRFTGDICTRYCPSDTALQVASVTLATQAHAEAAVATAVRAWPAWRDRPLEERAQLLEHLADRLQAERVQLAALQTSRLVNPGGKRMPMWRKRLILSLLRPTGTRESSTAARGYGWGGQHHVV